VKRPNVGGRVRGTLGGGTGRLTSHDPPVYEDPRAIECSCPDTVAPSGLRVWKLRGVF